MTSGTVATIAAKFSKPALADALETSSKKDRTPAPTVRGLPQLPNQSQCT